MASKREFSVLVLDKLDRDEPHIFSIPVKQINDGKDVESFLTSKAYKDIMIFVLQLNASMFPIKMKDSEGNGTRSGIWELNSPSLKYSKTVLRLRALFDELNAVLDDVPPDTGPRRFGNVSFKRWYQAIEKRASGLLADHLPPEICRCKTEFGPTANAEIEAYFLGSFGSPQRLDYGSGHELSFLAFLGCIWKLGGFDTAAPGQEERSIVLGVIGMYLDLIRRLIKTYTLEPAGSHGVWGLDDHSFLPYVFGSAQYGPAISSDQQIPTEGSFADAPQPGDVAKGDVVERERDRNLYFGAIGFINDVKKGPFWEHSRMLYDISGIPSGWAKINKGMIKMYIAEVLSKFPVVQHFPFGSLFSWEQDPKAILPLSSAHTTVQPKPNCDQTGFRYVSVLRQPPREAACAPCTGSLDCPPPYTSTVGPRLDKQPSIRQPSTGSNLDESMEVTNHAMAQTRAPWALSKSIESERMLPPTRAPWTRSSNDPSSQN